MSIVSNKYSSVFITEWEHLAYAAGVAPSNAMIASDGVSLAATAHNLISQ